MDLPLDILPLIIQHLINPKDIARSCLVNKVFNLCATLRLYHRVAIYSWHVHGKTKIIQVFSTLGQNPLLAGHVHILEIRDFPKALMIGGDDVYHTILVGLRNCVHLKACTWTRDGSLNTSILQALQSSTELEELEINGNSGGHYSPSDLIQFNRLRKISLIMPSSPVAAALDEWMRHTGPTLRSLTLICKSSPLISDDVLGLLAKHMSEELEQFYVAGCPKLTHEGVWAFIRHTRAIRALGLEGVSPRFDMRAFGSLCTEHGSLRHLRSITLAARPPMLESWMSQVVHLLSDAPLESFQIYSTGMFSNPLSTDPFWAAIVARHGTRLTRFSVHRMPISLDAVGNICEQCVVLQNLYIVAEQHTLDPLAVCLSKAKKLRVVHINFPIQTHDNELPLLDPSNALDIVNQCSSTLVQFGCNTKVWQVERDVVADPQSGDLQVRRRLARYENPDIPEPFLVVRA